MLYRLSTAKHFYELNDPRVEELKGYGFTFSEYTSQFDLDHDGPHTVLAENTETSFVDLKTIEDLTRFVEKFGEIIVRKDRIVIYNDYVE